MQAKGELQFIVGKGIVSILLYIFYENISYANSGEVLLKNHI
jgi:hypothetical protein